jgi:hypothetical protein
MSYPWPIDKLGVINRALAMTGDNLVAAADNGSDEWNVASPAYDAAIGYVSESHSWGFAKLYVVLQPSPIPPADPAWDTAYPIPQDCVHILWIKINQNPVSSPTFQPDVSLPTLYDIMGTPNGPVIVVNAQGGPPPPSPPQTPAQISLEYISNAGALTDAQSGTPTLILALQQFVMAGIYRGLHEDPGEGDKVYMGAERMLQMARTRYDQQKPKRQFFNSRMNMARRIRRPFPPLGIDNWGGSNTPG